MKARLASVEMKQSNSLSMDWRNVSAIFFALCIPIVFPAGHMFIFSKLWPKDPVNPRKCTCSCWDTVFKGHYEFGTPQFHHVYFNVDRNTLKMWIITVIGIICLYESFKHVFFLMFNNRLRWTMGVLFAISLHSNYYGWWAYWNFWNDDFYKMWYHQLFFSFTELFSSILVLRYMDTRRAVEPIPMIMICTIAIFHAFWSGLDQFGANILERHGRLHQAMRDLALMATDLFHVILSLHELNGHAIDNGVSLLKILAQRSSIYVVSIVFSSLYFLSYITYCLPNIDDEDPWKSFRH